MPSKQGLLFKMFGIPKPVVFTLVVAALVGTFVLQNGVNAEIQFLWLDKVVPVWLIAVVSVIVGLINGLVLGFMVARKR
ncbi:MAG: LapA family protein [Planctomycetota bacterium]|jgi:uncharacterized membrane protein HdeD (DUF308 family)